MNIKTIIFEVNRNLYLSKPSNNKSVNFTKIKEIICEYISKI